MAHRTFVVRAALVIGLVGLVLAGAALVFPAAAAVACPSCYGLDGVGENVYVEHGTAPSEHASSLIIMTEGRERVRRFYGELLSSPKILICATEACYRRVGGGGSRGMALLDRALFLSPHGITPVIASHELAHIELHRRIGLVATLRRDVPQWFDEGLAVTISNDPRYLAPPNQTDRCLISSDERLPTDRRSWVETASSHDLYAKAACRVSRWLSARGGADAVKRLATDLGTGRSFEAATR